MCISMSIVKLGTSNCLQMHSVGPDNGNIRILTLLENVKEMLMELSGNVFHTY